LGYQIFKAKNAGFASNGFTVRAFTDTTGVKTAASGDRKTLYGSVFYHFDRRTEAYLAADYLKTTNGYLDPAAKGRDTQNEVAVGMRFRF
jgi:predicted porin